MSDRICPCGQPVHYNDSAVENYVDQMVSEHGVTVPVTVPGQGTFLVPRDYIALHGIKGDQLAELAESLGFERV